MRSHTRISHTYTPLLPKTLIILEKQHCHCRRLASRVRRGNDGEEELTQPCERPQQNVSQKRLKDSPDTWVGPNR